MTTTPDTLTPTQYARILRWERWHRRYATLAFIVLGSAIVLGHPGGQLNLGLTGLALAALIVPIPLFQLFLRCPACGRYPGWEARLEAPRRCHHCDVALHDDRKNP